MFPLRDSNRSATAPFVTMAIIAINSVVWLYEVHLGTLLEHLVLDYGLIPMRFVMSYRMKGGIIDNAIVPMITSMFIHGGWIHIIGNMWFLWIFGDNVEDRLGHFKYLVFYVLCGIGASIIQVAFHPASTIPIVGASGAISGVLGAYLITYPYAKIQTLLIIIILVRIVEIPAFLFILLWFLFQFVSGAAEIGGGPDSGGVAYWAHMGGFIVGIVLLWFFPTKSRQGIPLWPNRSNS